MWLENTTLVSIVCVSIEVFFMILIGILQIIIPRYDNKNAEQRRKRETTLMKCESFQRMVCPEFVALLNFHSKYKLGILEKVTFDPKSGIVKKPRIIPYKSNEFLNGVMSLFNEMDAFAGFVLDETIADERLAFSLQGKVFCDIIDSFKVVYDMYLTVDPQGYKILNSLYERWSEKACFDVERGEKLKRV